MTRIAGRTVVIACLCLSAGLCRGEALDRHGELQDLQRRIGDLEETLAQTRGQKQGLLQELERVERAEGALVLELRELDRDIVERDATLARLQSEQAGRAERLEQQRADLSRQLREAYSLGRQERLKLLLNQEDPGRMGRVLSYQAYISRHRAASIRRMSDDIAQLLALESEVAREQGELQRRRSRQRGERQRLQLVRTQRRDLLGRLDRELSDQDRRLTGMRQDEAVLQRLVEQLERKAAREEAVQREPMGQRRGKLPWPVQGRVATRFGASRAPGGLKWDGVVINAEQGAEVSAVHHGRVAFADWLRGFGLLLILDHGDGFLSLYGFNQSLLKETGEWVDEGEAIALVGDSGGRSLPGLYFGIRRAGKPQNPRRWCVTRIQ
jgi:septal ring factor EnvC (AmiA/AmiB activator)